MGITSVKKGISTNTAACVSGKAENKMKSGKILPITAVVLIITVTALFSACSKIDYGMSPITETSEETPTTTPPAETSPPETASPDKYEVKEFTITPQEYSETLQLEQVCDNTPHNYLMGYEGSGYIQIDRHEYATFTVHVPSTQYYKLTLQMCAFDTGVNVIVGGAPYDNGEYGTYDGVSKGVIYAKDVTAFSPFTVNGIYLKKGENRITLQSEFGMAYMDKVIIENGQSVSDSYYVMGNAPINSNASLKTIKIMNFFSEIYGKKTITGQRVTPGTNAEIAAIYNETGRLPVIRVSDLVCAQADNPYYDENNTDLDLAVEWSETGGLVGYGWTWYSPDESSHYLSSMTDFSVNGVDTEKDISLASSETIEQLYGSGEIPRENYLLIRDIDRIAEKLEYLGDKGVTVLFSPLSDGGKGGYWWSGSSEGYIWLWRTMVTRINEYHKLNNIIWVWNGGSADYYPGDEYVDIVGENVYNITGDSGNGIFMGTAFYKTSRAVALNECAMIPNADALAQDNTHWLWFSLGGGDRLIDDKGKLTEKYSSNVLLEQVYNHKDFLTLDEIPKFE